MDSTVANASPSVEKAASRWKYPPLALTVVLGLLLTLLAVRAVRTQEHDRLKSELSRLAEMRVEAIRRNVLECLEVVHSLGSFYASSVEVDPAEFHTFASAALTRHSGLDSLEWLPRVPLPDLQQFEEQIRNSGVIGFRVCDPDAEGRLTPAGERPEYFPSTYLESLMDRTSMLGLDHWQIPERRAAMQHARDWSVATATPWLTLFGGEDFEEAEYGFYIYLPVYSTNLTGPAPGAPQSYLQGYVTAVVSLGRMSQEAFLKIPREDIQVFLEDRAGAGQERMIFLLGSRAEEVSRVVPEEFKESNLDWSGAVDAPGRTWHITCRPTERWLAQQRRYGSWLVLLLGVVVTTLVASNQRTITERSRYAEKQVTERTRELAQEIRHRSQLEEELARERDLFHTLLNNLPDRIYFKDLQSRFIRVNHAMVKLFGLQHFRDAINKTDFDFFTVEHAQPAFDDEQRIIATGQPIIGQVERETMPDGKVGWAHTTKMPLRDKEGHIVGTFGISRDITDLKLMEERLAEERNRLAQTNVALQKTNEELRNAQMQLIEAEKMQSIGRLAAGVAHEVKNPLAILGMGIDYLDTAVDKSDPNATAVVADMRTAINRADDIILGLLDFAAPRQMELKSADLNTVIEQALVMTKHTLTGALIEVIKLLDPQLPRVNLDANKMVQVLLNLLLNAVQAMQRGGTLTVRSLSRIIVPQDIRVRQGSRSPLRFHAGDKVVVVEIDDTGPGIPEATLARIFDPFYTTKPTGQGTGLGLTVTRNLVDLHRGMIEIRNRPEGGVRASVWLPAA